MLSMLGVAHTLDTKFAEGVLSHPFPSVELLKLLSIEGLMIFASTDSVTDSPIQMDDLSAEVIIEQPGVWFSWYVFILPRNPGLVSELKLVNTIVSAPSLFVEQKMVGLKTADWLFIEGIPTGYGKLELLYFRP